VIDAAVSYDACHYFRCMLTGIDFSGKFKEARWSAQRTRAVM